MAFPTLSKTWQFNTNLISAADGTTEIQIDTTILLAKNLLKGATAGFTDSSGGAISPAGNWQVRSSCNGAGAFGNGDLVDRWSTVSDVVHNTAGNNHSWMVLRQTGISALFEIKIDCNSASANVFDITVSATGFGAAHGGADGTATAAPTASSSVLVNSTTSGVCNTPGFLTRVHYLSSADGAITHLLMFRNSFMASWWCFMKPEQAQPWWTVPWIAGIRGQSASAPSGNLPTHGSIAQSSTTDFLKTRHGSSDLDIKLGCIGFSDQPGTSFSAANPAGDNPMFGLRALCPTLTFTGDHAFVPDLWMGRNGLANGSGYPDPGPSQFVQLGNMIFPWNLSTIQIA